MDLGYKDANTVEIQRVPRLGKHRDEEKPRLIIVRSLRYIAWGGTREKPKNVRVGGFSI